LFERPLDPTLRWIRTKFAGNLAVREANGRALRAGYNYGETSEVMPVHYRIAKAPMPPGRYRKVTGNEAIGLGLVAAAKLADLPLLYAGYPITPASDLLHFLSDLKRFGVRTFQAEDEIAAAGAAIGAAFGGGLGVTATSGPGLCLKSEAIGLAVMAELPVVVIDVQRGGPAPACPPRRSRPTCCKRCSAATASAPSPSSPPARRPTASP
jgi:2-oxoglutarate ferredoxin oxidoreductase subunit alpha